MAASIIPLLIRMACVHVVLLYGTNNTTLGGLTDEGIYNRMLGAKLVLPARIFYAMTIWMGKLTVSEFLKRLTSSTWNKAYEIVLQGIRVFLLLTFIGVVIATLAECHPFSHYWQVVPDPGPGCRNGFAQLFTMGISDIVTDIVLIIFPIVVLARSTMRLGKKVTTACLYSLSIFLIAIAAYRIPAIVNVHGRQQRRSLWASIEILASAAAANAVIIGSFVRDRGVKKQRFRSETDRQESVADTPAINRTLTRQHWGADSDEDLFRSVGGRMSSIVQQDPEDLEKMQPAKSLPFHEPHEEVEDEKETYHGQGKQERHVSEIMDFHDPGGLLADGPDDVGHANGQAGASEAVDFASALGPPVTAGVNNLPGSQTRAGAQEMGQRQPASPATASYDSNSTMELSDAGGLLR